MGYVTLAGVKDLRDGEGRAFSVKGGDIALFRCGDAWHAVSLHCTHALAELTGGSVDRHRHTVECPLHGAEFDLRTGEALSPPAALPLDVFPVRVVGSEVQVDPAGELG